MESVSSSPSDGADSGVKPVTIRLDPAQLQQLAKQIVAEIEERWGDRPGRFKHETALHILSAELAATFGISLVAQGLQADLIELMLGAAIKLAKENYTWERIKKETE